jgi:hypothetical protein
MSYTQKGGGKMKIESLDVLKAQKQMSEAFTDTVGEHILGAIQVDIEQHLFEQWNNANLDEGTDFAEYKFMQFAPDNLKQSYNEYYGYTEKDEFYLC